jgi:hypothetical protein
MYPHPMAPAAASVFPKEAYGLMTGTDSQDVELNKKRNENY